MTQTWLQPAVSAWLIVLSAQWLCAQPADDLRLRAERVREHIRQGRYVEAEVEGLDFIGFETIRQGQSPSDLDLRDAAVEALLANGRGVAPRTRELAEENLRTVDGRLSEDSVVTAQIVRHLGEVLFETGDYDLAITQFRRAVVIHERLLGRESLAVAEDLDQLGLALRGSNRRDDALAAADRALSIKQRIVAPGDVAIARTLQLRGLLLGDAGNYQQGRTVHEAAVALHEAVHPRHPETALSLCQLGEQLKLGGELVKALEVLTRAVALTETVLREDHPAIASCLRSEASALAERGDLTTSRSLRERALRIAERAFGPDHRLVAIQINDLANTLLLQGDYTGARPLYERARRIYQALFGSDHIGVTTAEFNLALLNVQMGNVREARAGFDHVIQTWSRVLGPQHPNVARPLAELAELRSEQGLDSEARTLYRRALAIREHSLAATHPYIARTLDNLARTLARLGSLEEATALSERALRIWEQSGSQTGLAESLVARGEILELRRDYLGASQSFARALQVRLPLLGSKHPTIAATEIGLATAEAMLGQRREAFDGALRAESIGRDHLRLMLEYLPERQALDYATHRPEGLALALSLATERGDASRALDALILGRSLTLDELASRRRTGDAAEHAGEFASLWKALGSARQRLANLVVLGPRDEQPGRYIELVEQARREKEDAERALADRSAEFRSGRRRADTGLEQVRARLPAGHALVSFVRYTRTLSGPIVEATGAIRSVPPAGRSVLSYMAFVVRSDEEQPVLVPLGGAARIDGLIANWRQEMIADAMRAPGTPRSGPSFDSLGTSLRRQIWDPVAAHLAGIGRVFVVPDGALNLVPLAALPIAPGRFLLDDGPVLHYLSAERDLVVDDDVPANVGGLLVVGGPSFADGSSFARLAGHPVASVASSTITVAPFRSISSSCNGFRSMVFTPLPGTRAEAEAVAGLWRTLERDVGSPAQSVDLLIGKSANESAVKAMSSGRRVLHIATHGFFLGDECTPAIDGTRSVGRLVPVSKTSAPGTPRSTTAAARMVIPENPMLLSGLALSGANRRSAAGPTEDDGILTAEEVASLDLEGVEWAVLSACNTGLGTLAAGEGVLGLRRAFQVAGVRTVIMSLWSVEDRATRQWMEALYRARFGQHLDTADSVHEASVNFIRDRRVQRQSTHPFYWAGFVAAGDWR